MKYKYLIIKWKRESTAMATIYKIKGLKYIPFLFYMRDTKQWEHCSKPQKAWTIKEILDFNLVEDWGHLNDEHIFSILV
jgi:hypothetical protein